MRNETGAILIIMLWLVTILSITATAIAYGRRTEISITRNQMNRSKAYAVARGGVEFVIAGLHVHGSDKSHTPSMDWWSSEDRYKKVPLGTGWFSIRPKLAAPQSKNTATKSAGTFAYGINDEESKLNVNNAPAAMLAALNGLSPELAKAIVIKRKRLQGDKKTSSSLVTTLAEAREEKKAKEGARLSTPFRTLTDLTAVSGVTAKLLYGDGKSAKGLAQYITACSNGRVNVNAASQQVLLALGVKEKALENIKKKRAGGKGFLTVDAFLESSGLLVEEGEEASTADEKKQSKKIMELKKLLAVRSSNFSFVSLGQVDRSPQVAIYASLSLDEKKVRVTSWRQVYLPPALEEAPDANTESSP